MIVMSKKIIRNKSIYFPHIDFYEMKSTASRIMLTHYPTYQQTTDYSCGPSVALTVLRYFNNNDFDENTLISLMDTKPLIGTSLSSMVKFFKDIGWQVQSSLDNPPFNDEYEFQRFIKNNLQLGNPVMVESVDIGGHWRVIIGYDSISLDDVIEDDILIFADPYDVYDHCRDGYVIESLGKFFNTWFDHCMLPEHERYQPWLIATP